MAHICTHCKKGFGTSKSLRQHLDSSVHTKNHKCVDCDRVFGSKQALRQHQESPYHTRKSPLDQFFCSFTNFSYNASNSPSEEFDRLRLFYGWRRGSTENDDAWSRYMNALVLEFNSGYGKDNKDLRSWQNLCNVIQIRPLPESCASCCKAIRECFVNIVDLVDFSRGNLDEVQRFPDLKSLQEYTKRTRRIFPKDSLQAGALLRNLLREIF